MFKEGSEKMEDGQSSARQFGTGLCIYGHAEHEDKKVKFGELRSVAAVKEISVG
jgi:hypothetical protein